MHMTPSVYVWGASGGGQCNHVDYMIETLSVMRLPQHAKHGQWVFAETHRIKDVQNRGFWNYGPKLKYQGSRLSQGQVCGVGFCEAEGPH